MNKNTVLIAGDSYAADWSSKDNSFSSWWQLLAADYDVTNIAEAGVSEYKIYQQIKSADVNQFEYVIVSHTSPYRVHTNKHPFHRQNSIHRNADLIFSDVEDWFFTSNCESTTSAYLYFLHHFDFEYYDFLYTLMRKEIDYLLQSIKYVSVDFFSCNNYDSSFNFAHIADKYPGTVNHLDCQGNEIIYEEVSKTIMAIGKENE